MINFAPVVPSRLRTIPHRVKSALRPHEALSSTDLTARATERLAVRQRAYVDAIRYVVADNASFNTPAPALEALGRGDGVAAIIAIHAYDADFARKIVTAATRYWIPLTAHERKTVVHNRQSRPKLIRR